MYIHNIDPVLLSIGPLEIRYYGLVYVIGFILVYYALLYNKELKLGKEKVESFLLSLILGTILGARFFEVFIWEPAYYLTNPLKIIAVWEGGMSLHGGIVGVALVGYYFCKKNNISPAKMADILVIPSLFALALGRIANFINAELVGSLTDSSWCVQFPGYKGCRHPVQLYGSIGRFLLLGYIITLKSLKKFKDGFLFWNFMLLMGIGRFLIDFLRVDQRMFGLSMGQYLSIVLVLVSGYVLSRHYRE